MKIAAVNITPVAIPRSSTLATSYGSMDMAETIVVELVTDEGLIGWGQSAVDAPFYGETAHGMVTCMRAYLAPAVIGEDPCNIEHLVNKMRTVLPHHWGSHAGFDLALWDLKGKALGTPVYQLLGGKVRDGIVQAGVVHQADPEVMAREADETLKARPYPILKMKIGGDPDLDVRRYCAVAEAVGTRAKIQVDGNTGYTISQAIPALTAMERAGRLGCIEQPVSRLADLVEIAQRIPVPVMADEAIYPPEDAIEVVKRRAASIALMKQAKHGGLLAIQKIAHIFEGAGLELSIAQYYDLIAVAAAHLATALPAASFPSGYTYCGDTILEEPFEPINNGMLLKAPDKPGFGVEVSREKLRKYTVKL